MALKAPEDDTRKYLEWLFFFLMNGKHVFWDLPFNSNQMAGMSPLHYGRCLFSYLLGCRDPRESKLVWLLCAEKKKKKRRKSTEIACYTSLISEMQKGQVFPCNGWLHRWYASVHVIRWMQGTLVLPHPTSWHLTLARGFVEGRRGPRVATGALLSWDKFHQISCGQLLIPWDWFSKAERTRHNILPNNTDVSSCF